MPLVSSKKILEKAMETGYAVGHFNIENMETVQAVAQAAEEKRSPVIMAATETAIDYAGIDYLVSIVRMAASKVRVPVILHLDHGKNLGIIRRCIDAGFTSIMCDASFYPFEKNVSMTKKVVRMARRKRIPVEAELGSLTSGIDGMKMSEKKSIYTSPLEAKEFVRKTGIDSLAISIGTSHGAYKFKSRPKLDFERLNMIDKAVDIPLVLHGASEIPGQIIKKGIRYGAKWEGARGLDNGSLKRACASGIDKVNIHTDLSLIYIASFMEYMKKNPKNMDPRKPNGYAREQLKEFVKQKIDILGSAHMA